MGNALVAALLMGVVTLPPSGVFAAPVAVPRNLLANPGFESIGADGRPPDWQVAEGCKVLPASSARSGAHAVEVRYEAGLQQALAVQPGEMYRVTGYTRRPPGEPPLTGRVLFRWLDAAGRKIGGNTDCLHDVGAEWTRFSHAVSTPEGCTAIHLVVDGPFATTEWFQFDDLSVVRVEPLAMIAPEAIAALSGQRLRVVRVADCDSFALFRLPHSMELPYDGKLATFATMSPNGERPNPHPYCDFDFSFHRPERANFVLIHTIAQPLQSATLFAETATGWREVARIANEDRTVLGVSFRPLTTRRMRLRIHKEPSDEGTSINEVQFLELSGTRPPATAATRGAEPPRYSSTAAPRLSLQGLVSAPADMAEHVAATSKAGAERRVLLAGEGEPAGGRVPMKGGEEFHLMTEPAPAQIGLGGLRLRLGFRGNAPGRAVEVALLSPNLRDRSVPYIHLDSLVTAQRFTTATDAGRNAEYRDLFRVLAPIMPAGQDAVLDLPVDLPDMLVRPGERLWLRLIPLGDEELLFADSSLEIEWKPPEKALPEYVPDLERILRRAYASCSEAHVYDSAANRDKMALARLVREVQSLDPDNEAARNIERRVFRLRTRVELQRPGPAEAPDWAVWQRQLLREYTDIVHWWIENRQISTGELGGVWADDTELTCEWAFLPLVTGDEKVYRALDLVAEGIWRVVGEGGYSPRTMDAEHAAEYTTLSQPFMMLLDYGNPVYVERCMQTAKHMGWWTLVNEQGFRHFRSYLFNATRVDDGPGKDIDHAINAYVTKPAHYAAWYCAAEQPRGWLSEWARAWQHTAMSTDKDKPLGAIPFDVHAKTGQIAPYTDAWNRSVYMADGRDQIKDLLVGAWDWTGDAALVEPLKYQGASANEPDMMWRMRSGDASRDAAMLAGTQEMIAANNVQSDAPQPGSWSAYNMYQELAYHWAWWASRDMRYLIEGLMEQCRNMERMRWLITEAEPYTDRAYIPGDRLLPFMMLGGSGGEVRAMYPDFAVSWEGIGQDVAVLVTERSDTSLKVLAYSFADKPREVTMRVWSIPHGVYRVAYGVDADGDGAPDGATRSREMELYRFAPVALTLAPGRTTVITAQQVRALDDIRTRADLALSRGDVRLEGDEVVVTVHNIGAAASPAGVTVAVCDAKGKLLATAALPAIEAPSDCVPRTATVRLPAGSAAQVVVDRENRIAEITEVNNSASLVRR